jgi:putative transposase
MAHSYVSALFHCVFSTKERRKTITEDIQERLWMYMGGIARKNKMRALAVGGVEDHVHLLLSISTTISIAKAMQLVKGGSSTWVHDSFPEHHQFEWQEGYGAFSIGIAQVPDTKTYIANQREHHRTKTFQENSSHFWNGMALSMIPVMFGADLQASLRDAQRIGQIGPQR